MESKTSFQKPSNDLLHLRSELLKQENKESCIASIKKWIVRGKNELEGHCLSWCYHFLTDKSLSEQVTSEFVGNVLKKLKSEAYHEVLSNDKNTESNDAINSVLLMEKMFTTMNQICNENSFELYNKEHTISAHGIKNRRRTMEDRHVTLPFASNLLQHKKGGDFGYFAVFDGHGGQEAADYAALHLHVNFAANLNISGDNTKTIPDSLKDAFVKTDENFCHHAHQQKLHSGTTGVCAVVEWGKRLTVAWLGDSQAMLVRRNKNVQMLTVPHKPEQEDEKKRIENLGGCVMFFGGWRVNGCLTVSRAIGDVEYKPLISNDAGIESVELDGTEEFLVLGCDGLFDTVEPKAICDGVYSHLERGEKRELAANSLVKLAQDEGSMDNISAIVVFFPSTSNTDNNVENNEVKVGQTGGGEEKKNDKSKQNDNNVGKGGDSIPQNKTNTGDILQSTHLKDLHIDTSLTSRRISMPLIATEQLSLVDEEMEDVNESKSFLPAARHQSKNESFLPSNADQSNNTCALRMLVRNDQVQQTNSLSLEYPNYFRPKTLGHIQQEKENVLSFTVLNRAVTPIKSSLSTKSPSRTRLLSTKSPSRTLSHDWIRPTRNRSLSNTSCATIGYANTSLGTQKLKTNQKRPRAQSAGNNSSLNMIDLFPCVASSKVEDKARRSFSADKPSFAANNWTIALEVNAAVFFQ